MNLLTALINAPLVGVQRRWPNTYHAVEFEGLPTGNWEKARTALSVCGRRVALVEDAAVGDAPILWPPQHRLPGGRVRCRECWVATGRKRPRSQIVIKEAT